MSVFEVPRSDWQPFCERFERQHHGEVLSVEKSGHALAREARLQHIRIVDVEGHALVVTVLDPERGVCSFSVLEPSRIELEQHGEHDPGRLRIESGIDDALHLRFAEPLVPGLFDGFP